MNFRISPMSQRRGFRIYVMLVLFQAGAELFHKAWIDVVRRNRHLGQIVEEVIEEDLSRQHRQEWQKY